MKTKYVFAFCKLFLKIDLNRDQMLPNLTFVLFHSLTKLCVLEHVSGADPAFLIRLDLIHKFLCRILGNYSKDSSFLQQQRFLNFQRIYVLPISCYNYKNFYLLDTFLGVFSACFFKPKLNLNLSFCFDIYSKISSSASWI